MLTPVQPPPNEAVSIKEAQVNLLLGGDSSGRFWRHAPIVPHVGSVWNYQSFRLVLE